MVMVHCTTSPPLTIKATLSTMVICCAEPPSSQPVEGVGETMQEVMFPDPSMVHSVMPWTLDPTLITLRMYAVLLTIAMPVGVFRFHAMLGTLQEVIDPAPFVIHCVTVLVP